MSAKTMHNPIKDALRAHTEMCRALLDGSEPRLSMRTMQQHWKELASRHGETAFRAIGLRARALVRELFGNEPRPPFPSAKVDSWAIIEADVVAEQLVQEFRRAGVRPSTDPAWRATLNGRYTALLTRYEQDLRQRAAVPAPASAPPPNVAELIARAVERAVSDRLSVREVNGVRQPETHYMGVWREGIEYAPGDLVTARGTMWWCGLPTTTKPGTDAGAVAWQMTAKTESKR